MTAGHYKGDPKDPTDDTPFEALGDKTLKTAGYAYLVGDAAIVASGLLDKDYKRAFVGGAWGVGGLAAARYGNPSQEKQLELLCNRVGEYFRKQGVEIPKNPTTADLCKEGGIVSHLENFLYQHPSEVLNGVYALGATQLVASGAARFSKASAITPRTPSAIADRGVARMDIASGVLIGAGALAGLLIPEKKPDPENPPKGFVEKAVSWIQEKPLRLSGIMYHANNAAMLGGAISEYRKGTGKGYMWRFLTAGSYIFANTMLALSSRSNTSESSHITEQIAERCAQVIAAQPQATQDALVQQISGYLAAQPEVDKKPDEIAAMLKGKLAAVKQAAPVAGSWQQSLGTQAGSTPELAGR